MPAGWRSPSSARRSALPRNEQGGGDDRRHAGEATQREYCWWLKTGFPPTRKTYYTLTLNVSLAQNQQRVAPG